MRRHQTPAPVTGLETLQVPDRELEGERGFDRRQSTGRKLIQDLQPALLIRAQGDRRGVHRDSLPGVARGDNVSAHLRGDKVAVPLARTRHS